VAVGIVDNTCKWDYVGSSGIPLDGFEEIAGGGTVMCAAPNSDEIDSTQASSTSVGVSIPIYSTYPGLVIRNSFIYMTSTATRRLKVYAPRGVGLENCVVSGTNPSVSPIIGMHGPGINAGKRTNNSGPFTPDAYPKWVRNCLCLPPSSAYDYGQPNFGSTIPEYDGREPPSGASYWAYSEWQGDSATYTVTSAQEVMRFTLYSQNITSITVMDPATRRAMSGQMMTLIFSQGGGTNNYTVGGWASNFKLCGGAFNMPTGSGSTASITFRFDEITSKWIEICRTPNAV
jgi:hypothetical protein